MISNNIVLLSDSYKVSHYKQYPPGTEYVYSYFESRGCKIEGWNEVTFFGLQYILKEYLVGQVVTQAKIDEAADFYSHHFGAEFVVPGATNPGAFNREGWEYILKAHGGRLPVSIKAVPEGLTVPTKNVLMTVVNTDPKCFWLSNYLETLLVQVWYPMTVCTQSREQKKTIKRYWEMTGCDPSGKPPSGICFSLHDFGFRGVSSVESAMIGGCGHLVNFIGTDTVAAMYCARKYYKAGKGSLFECPGFSIPASEHSTITSWGKDGELDAMRNMLTQYPEGLVACVSDSFDIWKACEKYWGTELKDMIMQRPGPAGRLVVRPDSGVPKDTVLKCLQILTDKFPCTTTSTGHKLLPPQIRLIQGDGVNYQSIPEILQVLADNGIAAENVAFGSGGALLQRLDRDTFNCAFKCSEISIQGVQRPVFKDPVTDPGKASKKGRLTLERTVVAPHTPREGHNWSVGERVHIYSESKAAWLTDGEIQEVHRQDICTGGYAIKAGTVKVSYAQGASEKYILKDDRARVLKVDGCGYCTVTEGQGNPAKDILREVFRNGELLIDESFDTVRLRADLPGGPFVSSKQ